ncbi:MAG: hypothetical protein C4541_07815 [Candidatus Auribacter fodinae]|uniref:Protein SirB1 N-terminal domain-containing protein n=1 Tax=Candidatus Auribacter fodinae TaxID=2093366 RepID=A0A3A4R1L4_9BACT|nr:MAG: hypothetical protein C4541_07815 [Candidatus Auribacter fodinae]
MRFISLFLHLPACLVITICISSCYTAQSQSSVRSYDTIKPFYNPQEMVTVWGNYSLDERRSLDEAIRSVYSRLDYEEPSAAIYGDLGLLCYQRCRLDESIDMYSKALSLQPSNPDYNYIISCAYYFAKKYDKAKNYLNLAKQLGVRIDPDSAVFFRKTSPDVVELYRARITFNLEKPYEKKGLYVNSVEEMLALPDDEIDLATTALLLSREASAKLFNKTFDIVAYRNKIDRMVDDVLTEIGTETRPSWIVNELNKYIYGKQKFSVPEGDAAELQQPRYHLMNTMLDYNKGVCMSLSLLYLSLAERMRLPVFGVVVPGHFFVRYDDLVHTINIETTILGREFNDAHYQKEYPNIYTSETMYYKNLTKRETIGCYLNNFGSFYLAQNRLDDAIRVLTMAIQVTPYFTEPYINLGHVYQVKDELDLAAKAYKEGLKFNSVHQKLLLGLGRVYFLKGDIDMALEEFKMARASAGNDPEIGYHMGVAYSAKGMHTEAIRELKTSIANEPDSIKIHQLLAHEYYYTQNYTEAWKEVKTLRSLGHRIDANFLKILREACPEPEG